MTIAETFFSEYEIELATTRRALELIPESRTGFRPHPKSWTLGELGLHLANIPIWTVFTMKADELDLGPLGKAGFKPPTFESASASLRMFDENVKAAKAALLNASDERMLASWTLKKDGVEKFSTPRIGALRSFVLNHMVHHRGQLTVYLRLCEVPLPPVYGPTADVAF